MLVETGQSHLFQSWAEPGVEDEGKISFFEQVIFPFLCVREKFRNPFPQCLLLLDLFAGEPEERNLEF